MTPLRWMIVAFWVVVIGMIIKGCHDSDQRLHEEAIAHPTQTQFFFTPPPGSPGAPGPVTETAADVQQSFYTVQPNTPGPGSFTAQVTLKNLGGKKAVNVQVHVRPYRGAAIDSSDIGPVIPPISETDPLSQYGAWVAFPDLDPGQSSTQSAVFLTARLMAFGKNPKPEIVFQTAP